MRTGIYLRQSLDREGTGLAVARQRKDCLALCASKGWEPVEYVDNDVSATSAKRRPAYTRLLADIEAGSIGAVITWDLDRLHRQPMELERFIALAERKGIALATVGGEADLSTDNGRLFARIKGAVARSEMERKSARQKAAAVQRAELGKPWGPRRRFGFEDDGITHRKSETKIVRRMYADLLAGVSQGQIKRDLNTQGILTTMGNTWGQSSVRQMLLSPRNAGLRSYRGEIVGPGTWKPIVSEDVWRAAVESMKATPWSTSRAPKYLLVGLARCGVCGGPISSAWDNRHARKYVCRTNYCTGRSAEAVEELVEAVVVGRLSREDARSLLVVDNSENIRELQSEASALRKRSKQIAVEFADGELSASQLRAVNERINQRITDVEGRMVRNSAADLLSPLLDSADVGRAWARLDVARKRAVVGVLMEVRIKTTIKGSRFQPDDVEIQWKESR